MVRSIFRYLEQFIRRSQV